MGKKVAAEPSISILLATKLAKRFSQDEKFNENVIYLVLEFEKLKKKKEIQDSLFNLINTLITFQEIKFSFDFEFLLPKLTKFIDLCKTSKLKIENIEKQLTDQNSWSLLHKNQDLELQKDLEEALSLMK